MRERFVEEELVDKGKIFLTLIFLCTSLLTYLHKHWKSPNVLI